MRGLGAWPLADLWSAEVLSVSSASPHTLGHPGRQLHCDDCDRPSVDVRPRSFTRTVGTWIYCRWYPDPARLPMSPAERFPCRQTNQLRSTMTPDPFSGCRARYPAGSRSLKARKGIDVAALCDGGLLKTPDPFSDGASAGSGKTRGLPLPGPQLAFPRGYFAGKFRYSTRGITIALIHVSHFLWKMS